ncbi:MAG: hypothetical protein V7646_6550 [Pseudonocardia sp.]|jgi:hypothetical protein
MGIVSGNECSDTRAHRAVAHAILWFASRRPAGAPHWSIA